ncbi:MAG: hypothetical protein IPN67_22080 [Bacteroidales bacterium]|nr:hypothetical protein [Bacteroidales bacterium]
MNAAENWKTFNPSGIKRILVTMLLPGDEWLKILSEAGYRTEVWVARENLTREGMTERIGNDCTAVIGQLREKWDAYIFSVLSTAGGVAYCNYAVRYDNVEH